MFFLKKTFSPQRSPGNEKIQIQTPKQERLLHRSLLIDIRLVLVIWYLEFFSLRSLR
jgi:hypothetical protein